MQAEVDTSTRLPASAASNTAHTAKENTIEMSSPLSVKRRKLNESAARVTKPFVSPLRTIKPDQRIASSEDKENEDAYLPSTIAHTTRVHPSTKSAVDSIKSQTSSFTPAKSTPIRKQHAYTASSKRKDPAEVKTERAITALELQTRTVKNEIDTLKQAARISSSTTDADLEALVQKWKSASQTAAEELFGTVKERVQRMGGVAAWRESEKKKYDRSHGLGEFAEEPEEDDDADCEFDSQGEELPEEEQEYRKKEKRRVKQEMMDAADIEDVVVEEENGGGKEKAVWQEPGGEDDGSIPSRLFSKEARQLANVWHRHSRWT